MCLIACRHEDTTFLRVASAEREQHAVVRKRLVRLFRLLEEATGRMGTPSSFTRRSLAMVLLLSWLVACVACAPIKDVVSHKYVAEDKTWSVAVDGHTVTYRGVLTSQGVQRAVEWLDRYPGVRTLAIESQGGETDAGMRLGDQVMMRSLDVEVVGTLCASSCANYVFISGKRKSIANGAKVVWHGSPLRPEAIPVINEVVAADGSVVHELLEGEQLAAYLRRSDIAPEIERVRQLNQAFFDKRGVDGRVTTYGQEVGCGCNWTFSVEDMRRFGIGNVVAEEEYPGSSPVADGLPLVTLKLDETFGRSKILED